VDPAVEAEFEVYRVGKDEVSETDQQAGHQANEAD
jgi:hypothetical protein